MDAAPSTAHPVHHPFPRDDINEKRYPYDQEKAISVKPRKTASEISQWIEQHKTLISIILTVLTIVIFVVTLVMINSSLRRRKDVDADAMEEFAKSLMMKEKPKMKWEHIAGLDDVKEKLKAAAYWPLRRPELFTGLAVAPRGVLLYGPPGTGKTLLISALAAEVDCILFVVKASDIMDKYVGESEKHMSLLFQVAKKKAAELGKPVIILFDEIDAMTGSRDDNKGDSNSGHHRRILSEFLTALNGIETSKEPVLVIGLTNDPGAVDEAVLRRLGVRIRVDLPNEESRKQLIANELKKHGMTEKDIIALSTEFAADKHTNGYSGSDLANVCREAAMMPIYEAVRKAGGDIDKVRKEDVKNINKDHFIKALEIVPRSVSKKTLQKLDDWEAMMARKEKTTKAEGPESMSQAELQRYIDFLKALQQRQKTSTAPSKPGENPVVPPEPKPEENSTDDLD
jgi:SpoVK/Ycf46/Vps4 family AAA+-type ATPase